MTEKIKLGISACLLGEKVRYDGGHKLDRLLRDTQGEFVEYVPVCPEVECGLPVPREAMQLEGSPETTRLVTIQTGKDYTSKLKKWAKQRLKELEKKDLCGFVFKSKSPSCGIRRIKVYNSEGVYTASCAGIWARMLMDYFPLLPVEEDSRLHDPRHRENFIEKVFAFKQVKQ